LIEFVGFRLANGWALGETCFVSFSSNEIRHFWDQLAHISRGNASCSARWYIEPFEQAGLSKRESSPISVVDMKKVSTQFEYQNIHCTFESVFRPLAGP